MLCILTSFQVLNAPKSWSKYLFGSLQTFFFFFASYFFISDQKEEKQWKRACFFHYINKNMHAFERKIMKYVDGCMVLVYGEKDGQMEGQMDGCLKGQMTDGQMDK